MSPLIIVPRPILTANCNPLFVIGNGFDIYHGVKSSYRDFAEYLKWHNGRGVMSAMSHFLDTDDLWGDFEASLARLNREVLIESVGTMLDVIPDTLDEDDDDFSYADYYASIDMACEPIDKIEFELPRVFKEWVRSLKANTGKSDFIGDLFSENGRYLNFNYTDFLETLYAVPEEDIMYIHGCRKQKDCELIFGHGENPDENFDAWHERNRHRFTVHEHRFATRRKRNGRTVRFRRPESLTELAYFDPEPDKGNYRSALHYYAIETATERIESYFENTRKKSAEIIEANSGYFERLHNITDVVTLGHSLSPVDYPYFRRIAAENDDFDRLSWHFSFHSDADVHRIGAFVSAMGISMNKASCFKL